MLPIVTWPVTPAVEIRAFAAPADEFSAGHRGIDLAARPGDPVRAALPGVIAFTGDVAGTPVVTLSHGDGLRTTYQPVQSDLPVGSSVDEGAVIGQLVVGAAHCGGIPPCLHWGLTGSNGYLDPAALFGKVVLLPFDPVDPVDPSAEPVAEINPNHVARSSPEPGQLAAGAGFLTLIGGLGWVGVSRLRRGAA